MGLNGSCWPKGAGILRLRPSLFAALLLTLCQCGKWNADNPTVPVGPTLAVRGVVSLPGEVQAMAARDNKLFVCIRPTTPDSATKLFYVVDAADPANPQVIGSALDYGQYVYVYGLALYGSYAYVYTSNKELVVLDISNPVAPRVLASYDTLDARPAGISGSHLYAVESGRLDYLSLADPVHPRREGWANISINVPQLVAPWDETRCAVFDYNTNRIKVIDFSSPSAPRIAAYSSATYISNDLAFCAGNLFGVRDERELATLRFTWDGGDSIYQAGHADLPGEGECLTSLGDRIVVGVFHSHCVQNLFLLFASGPQSPYVVGECELPFDPVRLTADGNRIYVDFGEVYGGESYMTIVEVVEH